MSYRELIGQRLFTVLEAFKFIVPTFNIRKGNPGNSPLRHLPSLRIDTLHKVMEWR